MTPLRHRRRGVTLLELIVALSIGLIVLAALFFVVQGQQTAYYGGNLQRGAQGAARSAVNFIEQRLAVAGFGMDGTLAFDLDRYAGPCPAEADGCPRDSVTGNDELVFYSRNPNYWVPATYTPPPAPQPVGNAWRITGIDGGSVTVEAHGGDVFRRGQVLQAVCKGSEAYAYVTVAQNVSVAGTPTANPTVSTGIPLLASAADDPFRRQSAFPPQSGATLPCFTNGTARMFRIDRYRFHVRPVRSQDGYRPYLVLDQGIDANGDGQIDEADEVVVAEGIEIFQVGYVMTSANLTTRGATSGVPIVFAQGTATTAAAAGDGMTTLAYPGDIATLDPSKNEYLKSAFFDYAVGPPASPQRLTDHQANIRAVRIFVQARGPDPDPVLDRHNTDVWLPALNENAWPAWNRTDLIYNRVRLDSTILVRNMTSRDVPDF